MGRKLTLYRFATYLVVIVGAFALIPAYTGNAEPLVSASETPGEPWYAFVGIAALLVFVAVFTKFETAQPEAKEKLVFEDGRCSCGPRHLGLPDGRQLSLAV